MKQVSLLRRYFATCFGRLRPSSDVYKEQNDHEIKVDK
jgi:hypothetical protein